MFTDFILKASFPYQATLLLYISFRRNARKRGPKRAGLGLKRSISSVFTEKALKIQTIAQKRSGKLPIYIDVMGKAGAEETKLFLPLAGA
jgi:hypothetical protein